MGQGGYVNILNNTGSTMIQSYIGSYQMESWGFPKTIEAGKSVVVYVEWCDGIFKCTSDDRGSAYYYLEGEPGKRIEFTMWNANERNFTVKQIGFEGVSSDAKRIPWKHDGVMPIEIADFNTRIDLKNWMSRIYDDTPINKIDIPGTHDSFAYDLKMLFGDYGDLLSQFFGVFGHVAGITQCLDIKTQLLCGCRFFDIRIDGNLHGVHEKVICKHSLWDFMEWVNEFLNKYNTETILMRIGIGCGREPENKESFEKKLDGVLKSYENLFWKNDSSDEWPLLRDVRGKIIVLDDINDNFYSFVKKGYGFKYGENGKFDIQDTWQHPDEAYKFDLIKKNICLTPKSEKMKINYVSATGTGGGWSRPFTWAPIDYADYLNKRVISLINDGTIDKKAILGVMVFDFFDSNAAQTIVFNNEKLSVKNRDVMLGGVGSCQVVFDKKGDANCDGKVDLSDSVLIMQALANPNKYGINGSDKTHITAQGLKNADVVGNDGVTLEDAREIQKNMINND